MSPTDPLVDVSYEEIRALLEECTILDAVIQEENSPLENWQVVRAFRMMQAGQDPCSVAQLSVHSQRDKDTICVIVRKALERMKASAIAASAQQPLVITEGR